MLGLGSGSLPHAYGSGPPRSLRVTGSPARPTIALPFTDPQPAPRGERPVRPTWALAFTDPQPGSPGEGPPDAGVEQGVAAFVKPPPMEVDHWTVVEFAASPSEDKLHEETEGQLLTASTHVFVAPMMRVTLLDNPAFEIKAKGNPEQATGLDKTATWLWDVRPKNADAKTLEAKVEVLRKRADGSFETIESYTRKVDVNVRVGGLKHTLAAIDDASAVGNKLTGLFTSWQKAVAALVALLTGISVLAWKLGLKRSKPAD